MNNPYFPTIKDAPVRTAIYTPVLPFGWSAVSEWLNPQTLNKDVKKTKAKVAKKSFSISSKSAKKSSAPELVPVTVATSLKPFLFVSMACSAVLIALFFYVKKTK